MLHCRTGQGLVKGHESVGLCRCVKSNFEAHTPHSTSLSQALIPCAPVVVNRPAVALATRLNTGESDSVYARCRRGLLGVQATSHRHRREYTTFARSRVV